MKQLILLLSLISFSAWASAPKESEWKGKLRALITSVAGAEWSEKLLGPMPVEVVEMQLPDIPKTFKANTDVTSYHKLEKPETEFDKLSSGTKAQFDRIFVNEIFLATRKTSPKDEDLVVWMNNLQQGGSREAIYQGLVLDEVYATLENLTETPSDRLMDFCIRYARKFFHVNYTEDSLKDFNLYTLKRTITEKGLNLLEHYEGKDLDDLYRWYAIYSADLAKEYAPILKSDLRKNSDVNFHYEWAKGMPIQHIKSEFIIKTHLVMNQLQLI